MSADVDGVIHNYLCKTNVIGLIAAIVGMPSCAAVTPQHESVTVRAEMSILVENTAKLYGLLRLRPGRTPPDEEAVRASLDAIEAAAMRLERVTHPEHHAVIDANLDYFLADVRAARRDIDEGDYYVAATIAGSCIYCHR